MEIARVSDNEATPTVKNGEKKKQWPRTNCEKQ
jgi:hypothetical protein